MLSLETCSSILDSGRLEIVRSLPVNFRVRNPVLGTDAIGTGSQKEKRFWHERESWESAVFAGLQETKGSHEAGFYQSRCSSTECSGFTKVKVNNGGKDISMLL